MAETNIEWTEHTWNPVTGCTKLSPGCKHCYAETMSHWTCPVSTDGLKVLDLLGIFNQIDLAVAVN